MAIALIETLPRVGSFRNRAAELREEARRKRLARKRRRRFQRELSVLFDDLADAFSRGGKYASDRRADALRRLSALTGENALRARPYWDGR
jgi:hypothetical protein